MSRRRLRLLVSVLAGTFAVAEAVAGGGVTLGFPICTVDLTEAVANLPAAADAALDAAEGPLISLGVPPAAIDELRTRIDESIGQLDAVAAALPAAVPIPMLGGTIEVPLRWILLDGLRFTAGLLNDHLLRAGARLAGIDIPRPLVGGTFDTGGFSAAATLDVEFSSWMLSADAVKRFDAFVFALSVGGGLDWSGGRIRPLVDLAPAALADGLADALAALHLDALSWATLAAHGLVGVEIGPPFLRLCGEVRFLLPLHSKQAWWGLRSGEWAAVLGMVIRF